MEKFKEMMKSVWWWVGLFALYTLYISIMEIILGFGTGEKWDKMKAKMLRMREKYAERK